MTLVALEEERFLGAKKCIMFFDSKALRECDKMSLVLCLQKLSLPVPK